MKLGVVPKFSSPEALRLAEKLMDYASSKGVDVYLDWRASRLIRWPKTFVLGRDRLDYLVTIGGDGTLLNTLHLLGDAVIPVITIRYGRRGFLCDVAPFEYKVAIDRLLREDFTVIDYMRLVATIKSRILPYVLNDYVITTSGELRSKVARIRILKDGEPVYYLVGDGVIVAPPTGSTAYSLAAGGPVVDPTMEAIIVTPLAPITFCSRSVVVSPNSVITVEVTQESPDLILIGDGNFTIKVQSGEKVEIRKAPKPARIVRFFQGEFYARLFQRCM